MRSRTLLRLERSLKKIVQGEDDNLAKGEIEGVLEEALVAVRDARKVREAADLWDRLWSRRLDVREAEEALHVALWSTNGMPKRKPLQKAARIQPGRLVKAQGRPTDLQAALMNGDHPRSP